MNHVNLLQEAPSTSLTGIPAEVYHKAKQRILSWNPIPPPKEKTNDNALSR